MVRTDTPTHRETHWVRTDGGVPGTQDVTVVSYAHTHTQRFWMGPDGAPRMKRIGPASSMAMGASLVCAIVCVIVCVCARARVKCVRCVREARAPD